MDKIRAKTQRKGLLLSVRPVTTSRSRRLRPRCHVARRREPADGRNSCGSAKPPTAPACRCRPPPHPPAATARAEPAPPAPPRGMVPAAAPAEPPGMDPAKPPACTRILDGAGKWFTRSRRSTRGAAAASGMLQTFRGLVPAELRGQRPLWLARQPAAALPANTQPGSPAASSSPGPARARLSCVGMLPGGCGAGSRQWNRGWPSPQQDSAPGPRVGRGRQHLRSTTGRTVTLLPARIPLPGKLLPASSRNH